MVLGPGVRNRRESDMRFSVRRDPDEEGLFPHKGRAWE